MLGYLFPSGQESEMKGVNRPHSNWLPTKETGKDVARKIELKSTITCPRCGYRKQEVMAKDACLHFYECEHCGVLLRPKQGDCCVFCSYGTMKCPPMQTTGIDCH
jgi:rubredoxin